jgi:hypothetical protein
MKMAEWLKECEICNAGLCAEIDRLKEQGLTERQACRRLVFEQEAELGEVIYSHAAIRSRYRKHSGKEKELDRNGPPKKPEMDIEQAPSLLETLKGYSNEIIQMEKHLRSVPESEWGHVIKDDFADIILLHSALYDLAEFLRALVKHGQKKEIPYLELLH